MKYYVNLTFNCLQGLSFCESLGPAHGNKTNRNLHGTSKVDGMASNLPCVQVHEYLRSKLCSLYENDCIFDKFECGWNGTDSAIMTGSYNNFFRYNLTYSNALLFFLNAHTLKLYS